MAIKDLIGRGEKVASAGNTGNEGFGSMRSAARPVPRTVSPATSIDASTTLSGKIRCKEALRIDGRVKGEVRSEKSVIVGEGAKVEALIQADAVVIMGEVKGDIVAKRKITLEKSAQVNGELCTPGIVIEEGAQVEGKIVIGVNQKKSEEKRTVAPARKAASPASSGANSPVAS